MRKYILLPFAFLALTSSTKLLAQQQPTKEVAKEDVAKIQSIEIGSVMPDGPELWNVVNNQHVNMNTLMQPSGLLVIFTCNTCPYVVKAQERTQEIIELARNLNYGIVFVNSNEAQRDKADSKEEMKAYAKKHHYVNYLLDENNQLADSYGATKTPEVFLFNGARTLVYKGAMEDNPNNPAASEIIYLKDAMHAVIGGAEANPNSTKSIGCSIKRKK